MTGELWAIIPVKRFEAAKMRLGEILSGDDRSALAEAMMRDVVAAACSCPELAGIAVVTCDANAAEIATGAGAEVMATDSDDGHTAAARAGVLILSTDIPLTRPEDLSLLVSRHGSGRAVTLARAAADGGTNALLVSPPEVIGLHFGPDSEVLHTQAARQAGIAIGGLTIARMAFDLDRPEDVYRFLATPSPTLSYRLLRQLQACGRMPEVTVNEGELS